jgi:hypothetical protein
MQYNVLLTLVLNAMSYAVFFGVVSSLSTLFKNAYPFLDELRIGLCFLSIGGAMAGGTGVIGRILDWRYKVETNQMQKRLIKAGELEKRLASENVLTVDKLLEFPLERVRSCSLVSRYWIHFGVGTAQLSSRDGCHTGRMLRRIRLELTIQGKYRRASHPSSF